jgi:hypothetical protein
MRLVLAVSALVLVAGACVEQGSGRGGGLADLPGIRFVDDAEHIQDRIFSGGLHGAGLLTVGGIDGGDERVTLAGRSYCGGLCAHWMTLVVRNRPDGWTVTGTTGPIAIA